MPGGDTFFCKVNENWVKSCDEDQLMLKCAKTFANWFRHIRVAAVKYTGSNFFGQHYSIETDALGYVSKEDYTLSEK